MADGLVNIKGYGDVSEEGYEYAKLQADRIKDGGTKGGKGAREMLKDLQKRYKKTKISMGTDAFKGRGSQNIAISQKVLREMAEDPDRRLEYEAMIFDTVNVQETMPKSHGGSELVSCGAVIDEEGNMRMWTRARFDDNTRDKIKVKVNRRQKNSWQQRLLDKLDEARDEHKAMLKQAKERDRLEAGSKEELGDGHIDVSA